MVEEVEVVEDEDEEVGMFENGQWSWLLFFALGLPLSIVNVM